MIRQIKLEDIRPYMKAAKKSGLIFCESTIMYGYFLNNKLIGFTGVLMHNNKAIFKNHFVLNEYRGMGFFKKLFEFSVNRVKEAGIKKIEATCTEMSIQHYLKNGFIIVKEYKHYKKVCNENI